MLHKFHNSICMPHAPLHRNRLIFHNKYRLFYARSLLDINNFNSKSQRSRSNVPTFSGAIVPTKIHYCVKLHQNQTRSFQVISIV